MAKAFSHQGGLSSGMERILAARGSRLRCKGWRQEAILRVLEKNLENAEKPEELIIYGGKGKETGEQGAFPRDVGTRQKPPADGTMGALNGKPGGGFDSPRNDA